MSHAEALGGGVEAFDVAVKERVCPFLNELGAAALSEMRSVYEQAESGDFDAIGALAEKLASAITEKQAATKATETHEQARAEASPVVSEIKEPIKISPAPRTQTKVEVQTAEHVTAEKPESVEVPELVVALNPVAISESSAEPLKFIVEERRDVKAERPIETIDAIAVQPVKRPAVVASMYQATETRPVAEVQPKSELPQSESWSSEYIPQQVIDMPAEYEAVLAPREIVQEHVEPSLEATAELIAAVDEIFEPYELFMQDEEQRNGAELPKESQIEQLIRTVAERAAGESTEEAPEAAEPNANYLSYADVKPAEDSKLPDSAALPTVEHEDPMVPVTPERVDREDETVAAPLELVDDFTEALLQIVEAGPASVDDTEQHVADRTVSSTAGQLQEITVSQVPEVAPAPPIAAIVAEQIGTSPVEEKAVVAVEIQAVLMSVQTLVELEAKPSSDPELIEKKEIELDEQIEILFEQLGITYEAEEIEQFKRVLMSADLKPLLNVVAEDSEIDIEHEGTHEAKRHFAQVVSSGLVDVEHEVERLLGGFILSYLPLERRRQLQPVSA